MRIALGLLLLPVCLPLPAADPLPGHSVHGEAFNEGPRQAAVLMPGTGRVHFPVTTKSAEAQKFFNQGVGQLHGFWYYEAERSFRQVAALDKDCAMAYWGLAMANVNNEKRAKEFLKKAAALKPRTDAREKLWIAVLENLYKEDKRDKKQRALDCIRDFETIVQEHPDDVEAKAFLAWKIWHANGDAPMTSAQAVDALLDQVFAANPEHPAHHYRIHLWDGSKPARALKSAAVNGQAAPGIAHMWHMPGHTYSKLKRHDDAVWQQEASTRVDHAYMIRNAILPDQIHNYAHNEEWLVRSFNELGRARDAMGLAQSLIGNPRHPKFNTLDKQNSTASYGRTRLIETLVKWELWEELLMLTRSPWIGEAVQDGHEALRRRARGLAYFAKGDAKSVAANLAALEELQKKEQAKKTEAAKKAEAPAKPAAKAAEVKKPEPAKPAAKKEDKPDALASAIAELRVLQAILAKDKAAGPLLAKAAELPKERAALLWLKLGDRKKAEELVKNFPQDLSGQAAKVELLQALGKTEEAKKAFAEVRKLAFAMDRDLPVARRLDRLSQAWGITGDWRTAPPKRTDNGVRPELAKLGPMHWHPPEAPAWEALTLDGKPFRSDRLKGKPQVLIFYLGSACTHCMTQVNAFAKAAPAYEQAGIQLAAVTLEPMSLAGRITEQMSTKQLPPFPIYCAPDLAAFKAVRAYDDFEEEPLHAALLIDAEGRLRWWDVSWEPFTDTQFLLQEAQRLLSLPVP